MGRLRVMISSTVKDLEPERAAVAEAIEAFRFERFRSEAMVSLSRTPQQVCEEMAAECDLFILILGDTYGWIIPGLDISVTEREFDVARTSDPEKVLVYVRDCPSGNLEPRAEAFLSKATDFRAGYFRACPFASPSQLAAQVKEGMSIWVSDRIRNGQLSASTAFGLPQPKDILEQFTFFALTIAVLALALCTAGSTGAMTYRLPTLSRFGSEILASSQPLLLAATRTFAMSLVSYFAAILVAALILLQIQLLPPLLRLTALRLSAFVGIAASALFLLPFGVMLLGYSVLQNLLAAALPTLTMLLVSAIPDLANQPWQSSRSLRARLIPAAKNALLATSTANSYLVAGAALIGSELLFSDRHTISYLLLRALMEFRMERGLAALLSILVVIGAGYFMIRFLQSYYGWSYIIVPTLMSNARRRSKL